MENRPFLLEYSAYKVNNRIQLMFTFSWTKVSSPMLSCQTNAEATDGLYTYYVFYKIHLYYLKAKHQISHTPEMEKTLMLPTSDIPLYELPSLNVTITEKPQSRQLLDRDSGPLYCELEQILTHILKSQDITFYNN